MGRETRDSHPISHMCHHTCLDKSFFLRTQALYRELPEKLTLFRLFTLRNALPYSFHIRFHRPDYDGFRKRTLFLPCV